MTLNTEEPEARDQTSDAPEEAPNASLAPERAAPERIGRYDLRFELASGGMGSVYLARLDGVAGFEKLVALKRIHPHLAKEAGYIEMFLDEANIASRITHPNVCSVFDFGEANGHYFLAMEYLVGEPLSRLCTRVAKDRDQRRSPLLPLRMARIIADACEGLHAAHELKDANGDLLRVVHRDVSPRNLFVTYDGAVRVVDFGLASARERLHHTATGEVKGTFAYMAPEQLRGGTVDRRVDIWSLGVALWETLALRRLFKSDTTANTMYALLYDEITPPSQHRSQVPQELDEIVLKALARDPRERWQTAREMGQALRKFLGAQPELIGPPELSEWMTELFPQGEARKTQLMELARMPRAPVLSMPAYVQPDESQSVTVGRDLQLPQVRRKSSRTMLALIGGVVVTAVVVAVVLGRGDARKPIEPLPPAVTETPLPKVAASDGPEPVLPPAAAQVVAPAEAEAEATPSAEPAAEPTPKAAKPHRKQRRSRSTSRASTESGIVNLVTRGGWAEIFKGNESMGSTPRRLTLPAGRHLLVLKPFGTGAPKRVFVEVTAGETKLVSIGLD